ncbi:MAG: hypothetical protein O9262_09990, partial [Cyclobacteriaceae bacterium]|nr:hypothetical protein [Cyclobacteriaceae bacterium]
HGRAKQVIHETFNFYYEQVKTKLNDQQTITRLDEYMLRQSAALLDSLGDSTYQEKIQQLIP